MASTRTSSPVLAREALLPAWVRALASSRAGEPVESERDGLRLYLRRGERLALAGVAVERAGELDDVEFEARARLAYDALLALLASTPAPFPLRCWNFVPGIRRGAGAGLNRYMLFNAGRHASVAAWARGRGLESPWAAASGVGHAGEELLIFALAADRPPVAVENPRQVPAYRYSPRFGPLPPLFSRAAWTPPTWDWLPSPRLLIAGTASVVGESSCHVNELKTQLAETCANLRALCAAAAERPPGAGAGPLEPRLAKIYLMDDTHAPRMTRLFREAFPAVEEIEVHRADICREELQVEVEAVAWRD